VRDSLPELSCRDSYGSVFEEMDQHTAVNSSRRRPKEKSPFLAHLPRQERASPPADLQRPRDSYSATGYATGPSVLPLSMPAYSLTQSGAMPTSVDLSAPVWPSRTIGPLEVVP
jgi:hypothetical protein